MEELVDNGERNHKSMSSSDRGYVSFDLENPVASGISTQLVPEFSRKLSFVECDDDVIIPEDISDTHTQPQFSQPPPAQRTDCNDKGLPVTGARETASTVKKQAFVCLCGESFEKSVQLAAHKRWSCKLKEKTAQCDVCKNWFASDMGLKRHMKHAHGGVHSCDSCNLRFANKIKLTRHWMEAHYDENKGKSQILRCYECGDTNFDSKFELECHLVVHKFEKHQQKLAQSASASHHADIHFSPYPSPPFIRGMRHHHPFHHPYGFGPTWSHFPFRPPPPLFPFMPCASFGPFRPPFPPPPTRPSQFPPRPNPFSTEQDDGFSLKSSTTSTTFDTSSKTTDKFSTSGTGDTDALPRNPHHNHEYVEPTTFPFIFHPPYNFKDHMHHHDKHHDLHRQEKKKWKKYLKLMIKGKVPPLLAERMSSSDDLSSSHIPQSEENVDKNHDREKDGSCEFKMACKFCEKIIEKNKVSWHQRKECPVLSAHRCSVCDRVFKKRHFLIRHMHEQNHMCSGPPGATQITQVSVSSLQDNVNNSLDLLNFSEDLIESEISEDISHLSTHMQVPQDSNNRAQLASDKDTGEDIINKQNRMAFGLLTEKNKKQSDSDKLRCTTCSCVCQSIEALSEHLKEHISQVLAVQKVWEWTSKSSEYFFLHQNDDEDELEGAGSISTATTSYFDSEITSTASSALQDLGSNFSSLDTTGSKDPKWTKPHKKRSKHRHRGEINMCEFCGEKFAFRKDLHYHMESIHKDSTLECPVCRKKFSWKKRGKFYERHLNSHYGVKIFKHKCEACGKTFLENSKLRAHMSLHNSDLLHKCGVCGKGYANKSSLVRHERKHTGVKPYQCEMCQESFMEKRELLRHSTTHTGLAPFSCGECGQGFTLKTSLMSHLKKKHIKKEHA